MRIFTKLGDLYFYIEITNIYMERIIILLCSSTGFVFINKIFWNIFDFCLFNEK